MPKLLLATGNPGKARELAGLLAGVPWEMVGLRQLGLTAQVEETGATFEENAAQKARAYAALSGLTTLADDSGLEVEALGGEPGVRSARYAGPHASDAERVRYLLARLKGVPWEQRQARFRAVIVIATPQGHVTLCQGECRGLIALEPRGSGGFGYDPIFYFPELGRTMAELSPQEKSRVSHRAQAAQAARAVLEQWAMG